MWDEIPAKEFCASVRDGTHDSPKPVESGRFHINSRHIIGGQIDLSNAYLISNEDFEAINKRSKVDRWDVLISMIGTVGEPCLVREEPEFAIKNIGLFKTKGELDGKWLYYYLTSPQAQALIRQNSRGTTQAYVPLGALRDFPVRVPRDREVMRAITNVLGGLDEKIDLNRRTNQTLEAMAQAIFPSWFVDFDPVKAKITAKAEGRDPLRAAMSAISGKAGAELDALPPEQHEQLAATAALFPDEMEESELGEIPKGWASSSVADVAEFGGGKVDVSALSKDNPYRAVYVLNKSFLVDNETETGIRVFESRKDHHGRLVNQAGLFTFSPFDATLENKLTDVLADEEGFTDEELRSASEEEQPEILARYICKIYIRNEERDACVRHLRRMNVHHASLFPDLIGASDYCNILTAEAEQIAEIARQAPKAAANVSAPAAEPPVPTADVPPADANSAHSIQDVLRAPAEAQQVEPGRIAVIAQELARVLASNQVVDWDKREAVQARLRNGIRVVLRKFGYPQVLRDTVTEQVLDLAKTTVVVDGGTF